MREYYLVTLTFQFPAWDEKDGLTIRVYADSKSKAIKYAKVEFEQAGHISSGARQGRTTLRAVLDTDQSHEEA